VDQISTGLDPRIVSIGHSMAPRPARDQRGGTLELQASAVGNPHHVEDMSLTQHEAHPDAVKSREVV
jgi:hypothetical protein